MPRLWQWMIPILAAICALWIQAALHGYGANPFVVDRIVRVEQSFPTETKNAFPNSPGLTSRPSGLLAQPVADTAPGE